jgi:hypothetical protein
MLMCNAEMPRNEVGFLRQAAHYLEKPSYLMRIANLIGVPAERIVGNIVPYKILQISNDVLRRVMEMAAGTVVSGNDREKPFEEAYARSSWTDRLHMLATIATGATSGVFGLAGLAVELPLTTSIMFRSIASIADDFGEDITDPSVRLECLSVFCHGGPSRADDAMESSYLTTRSALARLIQEASQFLASRSAKEVSAAISKGSCPVLIRYIAELAARFNLVVSQKFLAQAMPIISIATGAVINTAFTDHFNSVARFHFGIRKLERQYGAEVVQAVYRSELR